jgi:hypothetical protein
MSAQKHKRRRFKLPGKPLPKRLLRPFVYGEPVSIDDKQYVILGLGDRVGVVEFLMAFPYVISLGGGVIIAISWFSQKVTSWSDFDIPLPEITLIALIIGVAMHYASKQMKHNQFTVFDRDKGLVSFPKGLFSNEVTEGPWEDWSARLWIQSTSVGAPQQTLSLVYLPTGRMGMLTASISGVDSVLGYWSFLVQYMDKDGLLPDVAKLKDYPNRTKGLGTWKEWEEKERTIGYSDPYYEWLAELNEDPSLDEFNAHIEAVRRA